MEGYTDNSKLQQTHPSAKKSEEIQHVIDRMPSTFGHMVTLIVLVIIAVSVGLGWLIRYPDVSTGVISINANTASIALVSNHHGRLKLLKENRGPVSEGSIVAYIENQAELRDMLSVDSLLHGFNSYWGADSLLAFKQALPTNVSLGELNTQYHDFVNALQEYTNYHVEDFYTKQAETVRALLDEQWTLLRSAEQKAGTTFENLEISRRNHRRDSILYTRKVASAAEFDWSRQSYLAAETQHWNAAGEINNAKQRIYNSTQQLQEIAINKREAEKKLLLQMSSAFNSLYDNIKLWKTTYLFVSPIAGKLQYLKFWADNRFINQGEEAFAVVPEEDELYGQVMLPAAGAGKVSVGQEVIIKLDNYPYYEFGSISGRVRDISLISNTVENMQEQTENYMLSIALPDGLVTNYGNKLDFKYEIKGTADIVTRDRRLIQRMFDSLRYLANNEAGGKQAQ